jgi:hypothetical protein
MACCHNRKLKGTLGGTGVVLIIVKQPLLLCNANDYFIASPEAKERKPAPTADHTIAGTGKLCWGLSFLLVPIAIGIFFGSKQKKRTKSF